MARLAPPAAAVSLLAAFAVLGGEGFSWHGEVFAPVHSKAEIPQPIRAYLKMDAEGRAGVAEPGQQFEETDVVLKDLPNRRLFAAGRNGARWLVILECGGYSPQFSAYLFDGAAPKGHWTLGWHRDAFLASILNDRGWEEIAEQ